MKYHSRYQYDYYGLLVALFFMHTFNFYNYYNPNGEGSVWDGNELISFMEFITRYNTDRELESR